MDLDDIEIDPMDLALALIEVKGWNYQQIDDSQISLTICGHWGSYQIAVAWSATEETLRVCCSQASDAEEDGFEPTPEFYRLLNLINDNLYTSHFSFWPEEQKLLFKTGLVLSGDQVPTTEQLEGLIDSTMQLFDQYLPAFNLVQLRTHTPEAAVRQALGRTHGRA